MRPFGRGLIVLALALGSACAPRVVPVATVAAPRFPDFVQPDVPSELASTPAAQSHDRAWRYLQAGDLRSAERELGLALRTAPAFYPAEAASGYLELARKAPKEALGRFDRALATRADYVSALVGRGEALLALERDPEAIAAFEAAVAANPGLADTRRRVEVLKFRALERDLAAARRAAQAGRAEEAIRLYRSAISASPESPFLYRELGLVEVRSGDQDAALEHFRRATALDPADSASLAQIAGLLEKRGDLEGALRAYDEALAVEADEAVSERRDALGARMELARLPGEYRAIERAGQITRADLAALIAVRLGPALQRGRLRAGVVLTDVRGSWAEPWIMMVARAGVMDPFDNHTFQPRAAVARADLALAVTRLLGQLASDAQIRTWQNARQRFSDIPPSHLAYPAASVAVASGVLPRTPDESFQPSRPVTGAEASQAIERLRARTPLTAVQP
jgi:tetratricopeptide (TPR) repeat protein